MLTEERVVVTRTVSNLDISVQLLTYAHRIILIKIIKGELGLHIRGFLVKLDGL
jgi:hypothetical protein